MKKDVSFVACRVGRIIEWLEELAPAALAESWDRVGLQIGDPDEEVWHVLVALTLTQDVVEQAIAHGVQLIVVHHPPLFRPLGQIRWDRPDGNLLRQLVSAGISVYVSHTNFDVASRGMNDILARRLELQECEPLAYRPGGDESEGMGRVGSLAEAMEPEAFLRFVHERLEVSAVRCCGPMPERVRRVAVMGGSGASFIEAAHAAGADVFITGDVDFHDAIHSNDLRLWTIDAGHFATERWVVPFWTEYLRDRASTEQVSLQVEAAVEHDPFWFRIEPIK